MRGPNTGRIRMSKVFHKISVEIEDEKVRAMLQSYGIPMTDDNIEELLDYMQEDFDEDLDLLCDGQENFLVEGVILRSLPCDL